MFFFCYGWFPYVKIETNERNELMINLQDRSYTLTLEEIQDYTRNGLIK